MQLGTNQPATVPADSYPTENGDASQQKQRFAQYKVIRRNGAVVSFEPGKIAVAVTKAFLAINGGQGAASARVRELVERLTETVIGALMRRQPNGGTFEMEDMKDQVELSLMRSGEHEVARAYVLYREDRARERARNREAHAAATSMPSINVVESGQTRPLEMERLTALIKDSCDGLGRAVDAGLILQMTLKDLYDGVPMDEVRKCAILAARSLIEKDPAYSYVTARLLLNSVRFEVLGEEVTQAGMHTRYSEYFPQFIKRGIDAGLLDERLSRFDLGSLGAALDATRDFKFGYLGLQTLYDRYFLTVSAGRM